MVAATWAIARVHRRSGSCRKTWSFSLVSWTTKCIQVEKNRHIKSWAYIVSHWQFVPRKKTNISTIYLIGEENVWSFNLLIVSELLTWCYLGFVHIPHFLCVFLWCSFWVAVKQIFLFPISCTHSSKVFASRLREQEWWWCLRKVFWERLALNAMITKPLNFCTTKVGEVGLTSKMPFIEPRKSESVKT